MADSTRVLLFEAFYDALMDGKTAEKERLPQGVLRIEHSGSRVEDDFITIIKRSTTEYIPPSKNVSVETIVIKPKRVERLPYPYSEAVVTMGGVPNIEYYQETTKKQWFPLELEDLFDTPEFSIQEGQIRCDLKVAGDLVASVSCDPNMGNSHEIRVQGKHYATALELLVRYLNLELQVKD